MTDTILRVEKLSKRYRIGSNDAQSDSLLGGLRMLLRPLTNLRRLRSLTRFAEQDDQADDIIWALRDISFELKQGEVIGFIGPNGAGKSTLLKIISRITAPTSGRVWMRGRVSSLLEVGTGFHPELTGRENIYLNATILGMRKAEVDAKFAEIVDFSGVEKFLDTPIKRYSSGMKVRLAFAVAAHLEPEILIIDEVLAVGDAEFQKKCLGKMSAVAQGGRTVLFVSHNMAAIQRLCQTCMWLDKGQMVQYGNTEEVLRAYQKTVSTNVSRVTLPPDPEKPMCLRRVEVCSQQPDAAGVVEFSEPITMMVEYDINKPLSGVHVTCFVYNADGICILGSGDADVHQERYQQRQVGSYRGVFQIPGRLFDEGTYTVSVTMGIPTIVAYDAHEGIVQFEIVDHTSQRRLYQHGKRRGLLGLELPWTLEQIAKPQSLPR
jgi:lipopolysaccharide transport system ATP-binding protein